MIRHRPASRFYRSKRTSSLDAPAQTSNLMIAGVVIGVVANLAFLGLIGWGIYRATK